MTDTLGQPAVKPARPFFSSGPCAKPPGWTPDQIDTRILGRSHRSGLGKQRLKLCIDLMRECLALPDTQCLQNVTHSNVWQRARGSVGILCPSDLQEQPGFDQKGSGLEASRK